MTQDNTELLPVTQEDIAIALEHLGYDSVDDLHYWAENDTELRRFDELCSRFARHRLNTRNTEYICKCGLRVEPHRCRDTKGEF